MADPPKRPNSPERPGVPRWVKLLGIIVAIVALLIVAMLLLGVGGDHGPGRHALSSGDGGHAPSAADHG